MSLEIITIGTLSQYMGLCDESVTSYFKAKYTNIPLLKSLVIDPFEKLLKQETGFSNENVPEKTETTEIKLGDITFLVKNEKKKKKPRTSEVYNSLVDYLEFIKEEYDAFERVHGSGSPTYAKVIKQGDQIYLSLDYILNKIQESQQEVSVDEVKQTISNDYPKSGAFFPIVVSLHSELSLSESDALLYVKACLLEKRLKDNCVKPFESTLKKQTSYNKNNVPEETKTKWIQIGQDLFKVQSIPERTVKYSNIFTSLVKKMPKKITIRTKSADLTWIQNDKDLPSEVALLYDVMVQDDHKYISIDGFLKRLEQLKQENTKTTLNQKISYFPAK